MPRAFSWTGCYVGAHGGWGWGQKTFSDASDFGFGVGVIGFYTEASSSSAQFDTKGWIGGGQLGCDVQFAPNWVFGLEGKVSGGNISGGTTISSSTIVVGADTLSLDAKTDLLVSGTARLGATFWDHWLVYVKGGGASAHDTYDISANAGIYSGSWAASETRYGWTVGGGLEWAFTDNWSTKFEYQYYDFGSHNVAFAGTNATVIETIKQQINTVTFGLSYRFH
jgi:outer membrane immunogenic protein